MRSTLCVLGLLLGACTVDDTIIEDKPCQPLRTDECISGYTCVCQFGDCRCVKGAAKALSQPGTYSLSEVDEEPGGAALKVDGEPGGPALAASLRLLHRQGALEGRPADPR
jgi:hypothetical protein